MMNFTGIFRPHFLNRLQEQVRYIDHADSVQQGELVKLIERGSLTEVGRKYDFSSIRTYQQYVSTVPLCTYEDIRPQVMRMIQGARDVLWPGRVWNFAQSSGTTGGKSKYVPITRDSFKRNHYQGSSDVVSHYLHLNPKSRIFAGKAFILGGSFATELNAPKGVRVGDLSANMIENMNRLAELVRVPKRKVALMADWEKKLPALVQASLHEDITNLSGVPSWFLTVIKQVIQLAGASNIHEVWPNLEVFFHGGISFEPYRELYESLCDMSKMHFLETYNASEGFFAVQSSWESTAMLLLLDVGVFYEFIPVEEMDAKQPQALPAWEVEQGRTYELVITACNGLWRYRLGDTVTVQQLNPLKITIAGRTKSFINAFGEELMVHNTDYAIAQACHQTGASVLNYTVAPVFATAGSRGCHQWVVEFVQAPADSNQFMQLVDQTLCAVNSDYEAKRRGDIFLGPPQLNVATEGIFDQWLATTGRLGGQRKVPRLCNDRLVIDSMLSIMQQKS